jgi:hypothetical protein
MEKEELRQLLDDLPESYLDKLIEAINLWKKHDKDLPNEEYLESLTDAASVVVPQEDADYLDKLIAVSSVEVPEVYEGYLDKLIEAGKVKLPEDE